MNARTRTQLAYDRWASAYDTDQNPQCALEYEPVLAAVAPTPGDCILDAACGTGRYAVAFLRAGADVTGLDFSDAMLAKARAKLPNTPLCAGDLAAPLPFADGTFNKICCAQTLKHLPKLQPTFREFSRVLQRGGLLVFSVTHPDMVWDDYETRASASVDLLQESDIHHHTRATYEDALTGAGFRSVVFQDVRVSTVIEPLLTLESFAKVVGRAQILLATARKPA
jgi:SAM-dependent methyltransferase